MKIFTGNANPALAKEICQRARRPLGTATVNRFPDGETFVQINENIRGCDVYVVQPTCAPANDRIMERTDHDRRAPPRLRRAHHGRHPVLRLRPPGPQGQASRADHGQARRQPAHAPPAPTAS
jgi:hypothetical protein